MVIKANPEVQIISNQLDPNPDNTKPAKKLERGIRPWEPISTTLETLPILSGSVIVKRVVVDGMLIVVTVKPISAAPTTKIIKNVLM